MKTIHTKRFKNVLSIIALITLHHAAFSQWTKTGTDIYYNDGKVGIGTKIPDAPLQLIGDMILGNEELGQRFILHSRSGALKKGDFFQITSDDASGNWEWSKGITFMRNTGNVGIGTINPNSKLDVRGRINTFEIAFRNADGGDDTDPYRLRKVQDSLDNNWLELQLNDNSNESFRIYGNSCAGKEGCSSEYGGLLYHFFDTDGNAYHAGKVGIGTTKPSAKLSVFESNKGLEFTPYYAPLNGSVMEAIDRNGSFDRVDFNLYLANAKSKIKFFTYGSERMRIDESGNVGIGTTDPKDLFVIGDAYAFHSGGHKIIGIGYSIGSGKSLYNGYVGEMRLDPVNGKLTFGISSKSYLKGESVGLPYTMTIDKTGNVGIGNTSPTEALDVAGNIKTNGSITIGSNGGKYTAGSIFSDGNWGMIFRAAKKSPTIAKFMWADYDDKEIMRITNDNGIGIGTTNPENREGWEKVVEIVGNVNSKLLVSSTAVKSGLWSHSLGFYGAPAGGIVGTWTNHPFSIITNSTSRLTINTNGQVIIGNSSITTPGNYKLYVEGGILTERVKAAVKTSANWSDYVFAQDYRLMSLSDVETFVKTNKHLPGVPSADDVVKDGIDMAAMDATILSKVEELTLYVIELKKEIELLKKENAKLNASSSKN